jgi:hypothetical protein
MNNIFEVLRNYNGSIIIFGTIGKRIYYFYNKSEAIKNYNNECKKENKYNG